MSQNLAYNEAKNNEKPKGPCLGMRHLQAFLLFLNLSVNYINRMHPTITLVAMTNAAKSNPNYPEYNWNAQQKSFILSSFYLGYFLVQIPCGYCLRFFGIKTSLSIFTFGTGLITVAVPFCTPWGDWPAFCVLRFLQGLWQGAYYPAAMQHLAHWSPPKERSLLGGAVHTGFDFGLLTAMAVCGLVAPSSLGWPGVFYICGGLCFVWCLLWLTLGANNARDACCINKSELNYIEQSLKDSVRLEKKLLPVPWRALLRSKPFFALLTARAAFYYGIVTIQSEWPSYANSILKMNVQENALYSALPPLFSWLGCYFFVFLAHQLTKRNFLSLTVLRKCFNSIGMWGAAIGILTIGFLNESHRNLAVIMIIFVNFIQSTTQIGTALNAIDIAPNHAAMITAIANACSYFLVFFGPILVGLVVRNEQNHDQWLLAFSFLALILCLGDLMFLIWGTAKELAWNAVDFEAKTSDVQ